MTFGLPICGTILTFRADNFRLLYSGIALLMWAVSLLFSPRYFRHHHHTGRYYFFTVLTLIGTLGVFLSDDLFCTFIFFEIMSFASYPWVAQEESPEAMKAATVYLAVAVFGGMITLMGLFWLNRIIGSLSFTALRTYASSLDNPSSLYWPAALTFVGFAAKAGVFPLHIWLPKAHPVAPAPASALLSGILTKTGVFGMLVISCNLFPGNTSWGLALLPLALLTMMIGALMAVFSVDLKHTLACSSMSQIGFILTGLAFTVLLGHENALASRGTVLHMVNHSLIKLDLFLCAGAVYMNTHSLNLSEIRGWGRGKPFIHACFLMGYLGIIGMPLFNGYLSKSLIHEAILEYGAEAGPLSAWIDLYEKLFLLSGGLTAAYMTKLYLCLFILKNKDEEKQKAYSTQKHYLSAASASALAIAAITCPVLGLLPDLVTGPLASAVIPFLGGEGNSMVIHWFSSENLKGAAISLTIGAVVCWMIHRFLVRKGEYLDRWPKFLSMENMIYIPLVTKYLPMIGGAFASLFDRVLDNPFILRFVPTCITKLVRLAETSTDNLVMILRKSIFRHQKIPDHTLSLAEQTLLAEGMELNKLSSGHKDKKDYVAKLFSLRHKLRETDQYMSQSVSVGLLFVFIGLLAVSLWLFLT